MPQTTLKVLVIDDNRDGADALGLLVEELGHQVHVTYGGITALSIARTFRPDLMLIDLAMPDMDGCSLVRLIHGLPPLASTKLVAITGHADEGHKKMALKAGFDSVLFKPVALTEIKAVLVPIIPADTRARPASHSHELVAERERGRFLPINAARKARSQRTSKSLTLAESQAAICGNFMNFQAEFLGWNSDKIHAHFIKDILVVRMFGQLTLAERQLAKASTPEKGRDLIKQVRKQLIEVARPMLESMVHEVTGVKVSSMHHDISTTTGEELVLFSLAGTPRFEGTSNSD